ncbi:MAG: glycosyltransferase family 2 protein [Pirellulales bacterium]|nr:glycosyltransferase family 2 protein [Pirellulales bacterium]
MSQNQIEQRSEIRDERSAQSAAYVLVTPVYNEQAYINHTIASVLSQTILPAEWIIVSDRSTDRTDEIVKEAARERPWIKLIRVEDNNGVAFERVVLNTEKGVASISVHDYSYLGLLDADVAFQEDYFEHLMGEFSQDPKLGLAGGVAIDIGRPKDQFPRNKHDVPGALQFFRRECFESLGGLLAIPEGGWDCITCVTARMNGYKTKLVTDLVVDHLKPRNISQGGTLKRRWQMGVRDYVLGYHPLFELLKCTSRVTRERPILLASVVWFIGYLTATLQRRKRTIPKSLLAYIQKEQMNRLIGRNLPLSPTSG